MACIVPQPIIPCEAGADVAYISGVCPHVGNLLTNGSGQRFYGDGSQTYVNYNGCFSGSGADGMITESSVSAWIKVEENNTTSTSNIGGIFNTYIDGYYWDGGTAMTADRYKGVFFGVNAGRLHLALRNGSGMTNRNYWSKRTSSQLLLKNQWHHVAFTYLADAAAPEPKLFVDGTHITAISAYYNANGTILTEGYGNPVVNYTSDVGRAAGGFGRYFSNTNRNFDGLISNLGYWHRVLTPAEISGQYQQGPPADLDDNSLRGYWPMNEGLQGIGTSTDLAAGDCTIGDMYNSGTTGIIDATRPAPQIKQEVIDISASSATTAIYYNLWQSPGTSVQNYGGRLDEISMFYTAAGGGGGGAANIITASDTLVSNVAFSTVSGNAVIIDSRTKVGVKILAMNSAFDCTLRKDTSGGDIISYVPAGNTRLRASIAVPDGTDVYLDGDSNTTLTYSWTHTPTV
jgi:hypothetical protein